MANLTNDKYITKYSGEEIDKAIYNALQFNPDAIGCIKLISSKTEPMDFNNTITPGYWITDYYINGPDGLDTKPLPFFILNNIDPITGLTVSISQSINTNQISASRVSTNDGETWGEWVQSTEEQYVETIGAVGEDGRCQLYYINNPSVVLVDRAEILLKIHAPNGENCQFIVNNLDPIDVYTVNNMKLFADSISTNSYIKVIYEKTENSIGKFYIIGIPSIPTSIADNITNLNNRFALPSNIPLTQNRLLITDEAGKVKTANVTATEANAIGLLTQNVVVFTNELGQVIDGISKDKVAALKNLVKNKVVFTDSAGNAVTLNARSKTIEDIESITNTGKGKLISTDSVSGNYKTSILSSQIESLSTMTINRVIGINNNRELTETNLTIDKLNAISNLTAGKVLTTNADGVIIVSNVNNESLNNMLESNDTGTPSTDTP